MFDRRSVWITVFLCHVSIILAQKTLVAKYNMGNVTGTVTCTQAAVGSDVTVTLALDGLATSDYKLQLHEYRVNYDTDDRCGDNNIGAMLPSKEWPIGAASISSGQGTLTAGGMDLSGPKSIEGRSFVITDGGAVKVCATIEAEADYITAFANLPAEIGGTIIFRQQDNSPSADTIIYMDIFFAGATKVNSALKWQINEGIVTMDIDATTDLSGRCGSTIKNMYNPTASDGSGCTTENHANCIIGDMSTKHGNITIQQTGRTKLFFGDLKLPLSGDNSVIGRTIAFMNGSEYFACANIVQYPKMTAEATISMDGVKGSVRFTQKSPLDDATISVDLSNLQQKAGGYHVHKYPVPQKLASEFICDAKSVGGHFNPFDAEYPVPATAYTPDSYEVGDISGKFGMMENSNFYNKTFMDPNLQLFGENTIIGRSIVIHKNEANAPRWVCATILPLDGTFMKTAVARFTYPAIGYIVLRQPKDMWYGDTQIYVELDYSTSTVSTKGHTWSVSKSQVGDDMLSEVPSTRCSSSGERYNPYSVDTSNNGDYNTQCTPDNQFRCALGDLAGKHGALDIRTSNNGPMKFFFSDRQLPLSGPQAVIGRSITLFESNAGTGRLACADVIEKQPRTIGVTSWSAANGMGSPTGSIAFTPDSEDLETLAGITKLDVNLSGLDDVAGYHVHVFPTSLAASDASVCQAADVGGHVNPFGAPYPHNASFPDTLDQYEIGDLSGKFGNLQGSAYATSAMDSNLPMEGPLSIVGRSVVIHKTYASRWACGNILDTTAGSTLLQAHAVFTGDVSGTIELSQYRYSNGDMSDTSIIVNLRYKNDSKTTGHNWHVHVNRVTSDCMSCGPHYNPFLVDTNKANGYTECGMSNPLRCEMGDQSAKAGQYDIGGGKAFYTDVNLNLEGKYAAAKRSIVVHAQNGGGSRIACANLVPYGLTSRTYDLTFLTVTFTSADVEAAIATSLSTSADNVLVVKKSTTISCTTVTAYFVGVKKTELRDLFKNILQSGNHKQLGKFAPHSTCATAGAGLLQMSLMTLLVCCILSKLRLV